MNKLTSLFTILFICSISYAVSDSFYKSNGQILELNARNFDKVVHQSNYTTLVEFYAPWCGYCQKMKPVYEKAAQRLDGIIQVAAVNCDLQKNKQLCAAYGVEGFPTVKVFRPQKVHLDNDGSKIIKNRKNDTSKGKPQVKVRGKLLKHVDETYNGARSVGPIVNYCLDRIKNYVTRLGRVESLFKAIEIDPLKRPVVSFSKNVNISPLLKSVAIDWLEQFNIFSVSSGNVKKIATNGEFYDRYPGIVTQLNELVDEFNSSDKKSSKIFVLDGVNDKLILLKEPKIKKEHVAKFLMDEFDVTPREGPFSDRAKFLQNVKVPKRTSQKSNGKKSNKRSTKSKTTEHDEL